MGNALQLSQCEAQKPKGFNSEIQRLFRLILKETESLKMISTRMVLGTENTPFYTISMQKQAESCFFPNKLSASTQRGLTVQFILASSVTALNPLTQGGKGTTRC